MKKFKIPVYWEMCDYIEVEANSVEEAIEKFDTDGVEYPSSPGNI